jgi:carbonic anhydrase/acetyltransferase-like protein (isoleucine patch superfamily)
MGSNVVLWSGNHIGHHSVIQDNVFVASHAVISGYCDIGKNCFVGVNATIANNIRIGADCVIGAGALVARHVEEDRVVKGAPGEGTGSARRLNRVAA